jgi:hypothetical protein
MSRSTLPPVNSLVTVGTCIKTDKGLLTAQFFFASSPGKDLGKDMFISRHVCQSAAAEDTKGGDGYFGGGATDELGRLLCLFFSFVVVNKVGDEWMEAMMCTWGRMVVQTLTGNPNLI